MKITDALLGEHGVLYRLLDYCEKSARSWDLEAVRVGAGALDKALKSHAEVEEELLFQNLDAHFPGGMGPLAVMREEHEEIEASVERARVTDDVEEARRLLPRIAVVAQEHFAKEEQVLFPMALQLLGEDKLEELGDRWAERRGVSIF